MRKKSTTRSSETIEAKQPESHKAPARRLVLARPMKLGEIEQPAGTPVAEVSLLNGATINLLIDGFASGLVKEQIG